MKKRAIGYGRCGVGDELMVGQEMGVVAYARDQGMRLTAFHCDYRESGIGLDRRGLAGAFDALERDEAAVLIVADVDRLSRDVKECSAILGLLIDFGVELHTVSGGPVDMQQTILKHTIANAARQYRSFVSRRGVSARTSASEAS